MFEEDTWRRLLAHEGHKLNQGIVQAPRPLTEVLAMEEPALPTREGPDHIFDAHVLERLRDGLSPLVRNSIKVPILFFIDHQSQHECYLMDQHAIKALTQLDLVDTEARDGKLWMSLALAKELDRAWPTLFQFVRH